MMNNDQDAKNQTSYSYRFGTAEFDETRFELRVAGLPVDVERKALEVLNYLLRHAGEVVTKEELFREVWAGRITVDKVLPNAVTKLRRALGEANAERLLTQARIGYRLVGPVERIAVGRKLSSRLELAPGQPVPARENFILQQQLGSNIGSEVWLAEHAKTHEKRVYKFAADGDRLRALKREATLSRVLQESLEDRSHFVDIIDWNFENPPFFLECDYGGQNLLEWSKTDLPLASRDERLELFLQIADAVAMAHGVGVLHKDLKPANVLIAANEQGWQIRLTDFGSGRLLDPDRLEELGITQFGLSTSLTADSSTGTPLYVAPEVIAGQTPTVQSDLYALGIMLYQLLVGDLTKPIAPGWEEDIADNLLRGDIALATDGNPSRRLASVAEFALRLRNRDLRREQAEREADAATRSRQALESVARSKARRPYVFALFAALALGVITTLVLLDSTRRARDQAQTELERASALNKFVAEDLINQSNPFVAASRANASIKDVLLGARDKIAKRFGDHPLTEASVHASFARLFYSIELFPETAEEQRRVLAILDKEKGVEFFDDVNTRLGLVATLLKSAKYEEAMENLRILDRAAQSSQDPKTLQQAAFAWAMFYFDRGDGAHALPKLLENIRLMQQGKYDQHQYDLRRINLLQFYAVANRVQEAKEEAHKLIAELQARGGNQFEMALAKNFLAEALIRGGEFVEAESLSLDAQRTFVQLLGPDNHRTLDALINLRDISAGRKDWPHALDDAQKIVTGLKTVFGEDYISTNQELASWGEILYRSGDIGAAESKLLPAYQKLSKNLSAQNPQTQYAGFWLAATEIELGKVDEASHVLDSLDETVLENRDSRGDWKLRLDALRGLLLSKRGDNPSAIPLLQAAIAGLQQKPEADDIICLKAKQVLTAQAGNTSEVRR